MRISLAYTRHGCPNLIRPIGTYLGPSFNERNKNYAASTTEYPQNKNAEPELPITGF